MGEYRKRPVVVEAEQWWPGREIPGVYYGVEYTAEDLDGERICRDEPYVITIHNQRAQLKPGDWVITEPDGLHHYPCKPDIFIATYEPASVQSNTADLAAAHSRIAELEKALAVTLKWCPRCAGKGTEAIVRIRADGTFGPDGDRPCQRCTPLRALLPQTEAAAGGEGERK